MCQTNKHSDSTRLIIFSLVVLTRCVIRAIYSHESEIVMRKFSVQIDNIIDVFAHVVRENLCIECLHVFRMPEVKDPAC